MIYKICKYCGNSFLSRPDRGMFCGLKCRGESQKVRNSVNCIICNKTFYPHPGNKGLCCSKDCAGKELSKRYRFGNTPNWKGGGVSYRALHCWVVKWRGTPSACEHCGKKGKGHGMHWANRSRKYLRDVSDWIRLCPSCHKKFDS